MATQSSNGSDRSQAILEESNGLPKPTEKEDFDKYGQQAEDHLERLVSEREPTWKEVLAWDAAWFKLAGHKRLGQTLRKCAQKAGLL